MKKKTVLLTAALVGGVAAAFLRAAGRHRAVSDVGLVAGGDPAVWLLRLFCAVLIGLLWAATRDRAPADGAATGPSVGQSMGFRVFTLASSVVLLLSVVLSLVGGIATVSQTLFAVFTAVTAVCFAATALPPLGLDLDFSALFRVVPLFWGCFWVILAYRRHGVNPSLDDFLFEQLAMLASLLSLYSLASLFYGKIKPCNAFFFLLSASFLLILVLGGAVLSEWIYGGVPAYLPESASPDASERLRFLALILYLISAAASMPTREAGGRRLRARGVV